MQAQSSLAANQFHVFVRVCERQDGDQFVVNPSRVAIHFRGVLENDGTEAYLLGALGMLTTEQFSDYKLGSVRLGGGVVAEPTVLVAEAAGKRVDIGVAFGKAPVLTALRDELLAGAEASLTVTAQVSAPQFTRFDTEGFGCPVLKVFRLAGVAARAEQLYQLNGLPYILLGSSPVRRLFVPAADMLYKATFDAVYADLDKLEAAIRSPPAIRSAETGERAAKSPFRPVKKEEEPEEVKPRCV